MTNVVLPARISPRIRRFDAALWTQARLARLLEHYRLRYWPRSRRLRRYPITSAPLDGAYGQCDFDARRVVIDVSTHRSDRDVRATVLDEMAHVVVGPPGGHHSPFWEQLEYLLSKHAPVTVGFPELGEQSQHLDAIPRRFHRCRRLFGPVYARRLRSWNRKFASCLLRCATGTRCAAASGEDAASS
jgi:hypothetical protein